MPQGQTITANICCQQLNHLQQVLVIKCPALANQKWIIITDSEQDNARPHTARSIQEIKLGS